MSGRLIPKFNAWVTQSIYYPGDNEETILLKRIYWISILFIVFFLSLFIPVFYLYKLTYWLILAAIYIGFHFINLVIFYTVRRGIKWFALSTQIAHVIISFIMVLIGGGILHSGGTVFIGMAGPLFALIFQNKRTAVIFLMVYLFTVIIEALLQPFIVHYPLMTPGINLFFFLTHFFTIVIVFFTALMYYANQTNKMKVEETMRLKELDNAKTKLYVDISHEFRTPLTIILGMADQMAGSYPKKLEEGLKMIKRNGENMLHLINQMLELSKIEARALRVNYFQGEIIGYLRYIFQSFYSLAGSKNIRLNFHSDDDQLIMDYDPDKIMQIISNLLSNAIKFEFGETKTLFS